MLSPPDPLTRACAPGPRWGLCPQTPVIGLCSALAMVPPQPLIPSAARDHNPREKKTALNYIFNTPRTCQVQKRQSICKIAFNRDTSEFISNLFLSTCQCKNCKKITDAVTSMDQNLPIEQTHFSQSTVGCERRSFSTNVATR